MRRLGMEKRNGLYGYLFCAPFIIGLILLFVNTLVFSVTLSFNQLNTTTSGYTLEWKGLEYYQFALLEDPNFIPDMLSSVWGLLQNLIVILFYSLFIAILLNNSVRGKGFFRVIFFLPVITATGIISTLEGNDMLTQNIMTGAQSTYSSLSGEQVEILTVLQNIFGVFDASHQFIGFIFEAVNNIYDIITGAGVQIIVFLAGLQSISPSLYEAADVEGCTGWERFWKITLPMVSPLIMVNTVWTVVDFSLSPSNVVMSTITEKFSAAQYSLSAAMSFLNFLVIGILLLVILPILNRFVFYENR